MTGRWLTSARTLCAGVMLVLMLGGCGDEPDATEAEASLESSREQVESRFQEAAGVFRTAGLELQDTTGEWSMCRMEPKSGMEFHAAGSVTGDGDPGAQVAAAAEALTGDGWEQDSAGETPRPYAILVDGDLRLTVAESKLRPGMVTISLTGPCLDSTTEQENELQGQRFTLL